MPVIKFDNELLNEYFKDKTGKEEYTIEDLNSLYEGKRNVDCKNVGKSITQHDLDILCSLNSIKFSGIDFTNMKISNANIEKLYFVKCSLKDIEFENTMANKVIIDNCILKDDSIEQLSNIEGIEQLSVWGENKPNREKILSEFPNYNDLPIEKKNEIYFNPKNRIRSEINLDALSKFESLKELCLDNINLKKDSLNGISSLNNIEKLKILDVDIDENLEIPKNDAIKRIIINKIKSFKIFKNIKNLKTLEINQAGAEYTYGEYLINLNVENLYLNGINNVLDILPISRNAKEVSLKNCNVSEVSSFLEYPELKYLNLEGNNIGVDSINDLNKIIQNGIDLRFENTDAHKFLKSQKIEIEDADVERDIKSIFRCFSDEPLNEYDIFIDNSRNNSIIKNKKVLETLISKGLIDKIKSENIRIELDDFLGVDVEKILNFKNRIKHIEVKSFNGLTSEKLDKLSNINWCVDGDSLTPKYEDVYYNSQDMKDILEAMERIKASIPENAGDLEKFLTVYKNIGMYAHYDRSGNLSSEEYVEGNEKVTRSLKGALVKGKAVCRGYALALKYCVKFVDVEARDISGYAYGDPDKGHSWNQVKIEDKWYNTDLTWDYRYVGKEVELKNCLKSDVEFYKNHTVSSTEVAKVCNESYDSEIIVEKLKSIRGTDLDKSITDATEEIKEDIGVVNDTQSKLVTFQDFRKIAEENSINPSTLNDLTQINEGRIENKRRKEISANEH